jgi:endo-1,4-beta-D-glucanase Y
MWIIYPLFAYALMTAGHGWFVYRRTPIPGSKIKREVSDGG